MQSCVCSILWKEWLTRHVAVVEVRLTHLANSGCDVPFQWSRSRERWQRPDPRCVPRGNVEDRSGLMSESPRFHGRHRGRSRRSELCRVDLLCNLCYLPASFCSYGEVAWTEALDSIHYGRAFLTGHFSECDTDLAAVRLGCCHNRASLDPRTRYATATSAYSSGFYSEGYTERS